MRCPVLLGCLACLCAAGAVRLPAGEPAAETRKKVLIIGIDGVRPDALEKARTPHLDGLIREGAFADDTRILGERYRESDTISGPGWSSILTGVWADKHGVNDNTFRGKNYELFPHFFKRLKAHRPDARTVSLVSWSPIDEHVVSEADVRHVEPLPGGSARTLDLNVPAAGLQIDTRDGRWHHLLAVRGGKEVRLFLDGRLAGAVDDTAGAYELGGGLYFLGRDSRTGETCFQGRLDHVRLWNRALSREEIEALARGGLPGIPRPSRLAAANAIRSDGLLAQYTFETSGGKPVADGQPAGGPIDDTAGHPGGPFHAEPVTDGGQASYAAGAAPPLTAAGASRHVLDLPQEDGSSQGARVPLKEPLTGITQGDFTVEAWFRTTDPGRNILLGNYAGSVGALNLELHTGNRVRVYVQPPPDTGDRLAREDEMDRNMARRAAKTLCEDDPAAMFVYFHQVDSTGHTLGFSPEVPRYVQAIENVDGHVGHVLEALRSRPTYGREDWLVIVCTDHGGIGRRHGGGHDVPEVLRTFLIVSGPSSRIGRIEGQTYLVDVAATALAHLGVPLDPRWQLDGRPVGLNE